MFYCHRVDIFHLNPQSFKLEEWKDFLKRFLDWGDTKWCQPIMSQLVDDPTKITPIIDEILTVFI
mgnify:CR=1 FL=1